MKLPTFKRLIKSDYPEEFQSVIERLAITLNSSFDVLFEALNGKLTIKDNFLGTVRSVDLNVDASGIPLNTTSFKLDRQFSVIGIIVIRVENLTNSSSYPLSGVTVSFTQSENVVRVDHVTGLKVGDNYRLTLEARG